MHTEQTYSVSAQEGTSVNIYLLSEPVFLSPTNRLCSLTNENRKKITLFLFLL